MTCVSSHIETVHLSIPTAYLILQQVVLRYLEVKGPISQNDICIQMMPSSPKKPWFQIFVKLVKPFGHMKRLRILQMPIPYRLSYDYHNL